LAFLRQSKQLLGSSVPHLDLCSLAVGSGSEAFSIPESRPRQSRNFFGEHAGLIISQQLVIGRLTAPDINPAQGSVTPVDDVIVAALMAKDAPGRLKGGEQLGLRRHSTGFRPR